MLGVYAVGFTTASIAAASIVGAVGTLVGLPVLVGGAALGVGYGLYNTFS
jgi:hypothetical protein